MALEVNVWGDYACFTRPELKVERVTYPVMTPSAARGVLEAIFWKPEVMWEVREIQVQKPIRYVSLVRNEINNRQSEGAARGWAATGLGGYDATSTEEKHRTQRHTLALRDVEYLIRADVLIKGQPGADAAKYRDQFRRRVEKGQRFHQPYLGTREFAAYFGPSHGPKTPIAHDESIGRMLFDLTYSASTGEPSRPLFFDARLDKGVLRVPRELYAKLKDA